MPHPIVWNSTEDRLLRFSIQKYGKNNWYKIFFNLYTKSKPQLKSKWKGWSQPIIQKQNWRQLEDILLYNSLRQYISTRFLQKYHFSNRTLWQRFFRSKLIVSLNQFKQPKKKHNQSAVLNQDFISENFPIILPPTHIKIQMVNNEYLVQATTKFKGPELELYYSIHKDKNTYLPASIKKPTGGVPVLKKLYYRGILEQYLSHKR